MGHQHTILQEVGQAQEAESGIMPGVAKQIRAKLVPSLSSLRSSVSGVVKQPSTESPRTQSYVHCTVYTYIL